ncbi:MAG: histidine kinase dimerization/phospho-acceptor domain-containing protein, partial [Solirubrobacteraceae bacterium]
MALVGVALLSLAVATVLSDQGLQTRLGQSARERLTTAAHHTAELAAALYAQQGDSWSAHTLGDLGHLAGISGYRVAVFDAGGRALSGAHQAAPAAVARMIVDVGGHSVGAVVLTLPQGQLLSTEDRRLESRLADLHLLAALIALAAGLAAAVLIAPRLARPLSELTEATRRIERGELQARVRPAGTPETAAVGRAFNRLAETLQHEEEVRRDAAADIAHELRTPLAGIVSRIEAAQDGVLADEAGNLESMHTEALRLTRLVEDLGKLAEAQQPGLALKKESLDLRALVQERTRVYGDYLHAKDVKLEERLRPARAYGDRGRVAQILDNLLSNALRYTDAGGTVTVTL